MRAWLRRWLLGDDWIEMLVRADQIANLNREVSSLLGRVRAAENSAAAANSRAERLETALARMDGQLRDLQLVERIEELRR